MFELHEIETVLADVRAVVDEVLRVDLVLASSPALLTFLSGLDQELNRLAHGQRRVIGELDQRGVAGETGSRSIKDLVAQLLLVSPFEASRRVKAAKTFTPYRSLIGELLEPVVPMVATALETGEISLAHAEVIADLLDALPGDVEAEHGLVAQVFLLEQATQVDPPTLAKIAQRLRDTLDQDGALDREKRQQRERSFRLIDHSDGSSTPAGRWTPALTTAWKTILDPLMAPQTADPADPDTRTPDQRRHDAMLEAGLRLARSGELPASGGTPTTIAVTITFEQLMAAAASAKGDDNVRAGSATNAFGDLLPIPELMRLATEAEIIPVVLDNLGGVLAYGRSRRFAPPGLRRALAARDKGCAMPGCTRGVSWTEAHHVTDWIIGGETNVDELVLLCRYDHDSFEQRGWVITMRDGVPWSTPPPWLDPHQRPRRNTAHEQMLVDLPAMLDRQLEPV